VTSEKASISDNILSKTAPNFSECRPRVSVTSSYPWKESHV
jgi:hypothetical protein